MSGVTDFVFCTTCTIKGLRHGDDYRRLYVLLKINYSLSLDDVGVPSVNCLKIVLRKEETVRWTSLKTHSLQVPKAARVEEKDELFRERWNVRVRCSRTW